MHLSNSGASPHDNECFNLKFGCCAHDQSPEKVRSFSAEFETRPIPTKHTIHTPIFPTTCTLALGNIWHPWTILLSSRNYLFLSQNTYLFWSALNHQITASVITKLFPHIAHNPQTCVCAFYEMWVQKCRRPSNREGFTILLMHSSVRINNSCEVWTRRRIKPVTRSYIMIFLIIRSPCWTASKLWVDPTGSPGVGDESRSLRALSSAECKCELWSGVSIFKLVGSFLRFSISIRAILWVFCQALLTYKRFRRFMILSVAYRAFFPEAYIYMWRYYSSPKGLKRTFALCDTYW